MILEDSRWSVICWECAKVTLLCFSIDRGGKRPHISLLFVLYLFRTDDRNTWREFHHICCKCQIGLRDKMIWFQQTSGQQNVVYNLWCSIKMDDTSPVPHIHLSCSHLLCSKAKWREKSTQSMNPWWMWAKIILKKLVFIHEEKMELLSYWSD